VSSALFERPCPARWRAKHVDTGGWRWPTVTSRCAGGRRHCLGRST